MYLHFLNIEIHIKFQDRIITVFNLWVVLLQIQNRL